MITAPAAADTGSTQVRIGAPLKCTVHAPHCAMPQPNFVPFRPMTSRNTHSSGMSGWTSTVRDWPLTVKLTLMPEPSLPGVNRARPPWPA